MNRASLLWVALCCRAAFAQGAEAVDAGLPEHALAPVPLAAMAPVPEVKPKAEEGGTTLKAGFGEGVTVQHGEFKLNLRGRVQVQAFAVIPTEEDSGIERANGIMVRRARLNLRGEMPFHLSFTLQLAFANQDMEADAPNVLRDFFAEWRRFRDVSVRFGQGKVQYGVQRVVSSAALQFVDRSTVTREFNLDRDVGVTLFSDDLFGLGGRLQYALSVFGGDGRNRIGTNVGLLYVARVRVSPFGSFNERFEGDPDRLDKVRLGIGGGVAYNVQTNRPRSTTGTPYTAANFDYFHAGGDVVFKWKGFSFASEISYRQADQLSETNEVNGAPLTEYSRPGWGWFAQAGYYVLPWLELAARYGDGRPFEGADPKFVRTRELGGTVNFMVVKHDLKLQVDYFYLDDGHQRDARHELRAQAQIFF